MAVMDKNHPIKLLPSMRTTRVLNTRPNTMMFSLFRTSNRETQYKWIGPLTDGTIYFYTRSDSNLTITSLEDLKKLNRIATRHDGVIPRLLLKMGFDNLDRGATTSIQVYKKLLIGRVDAAISDTDLGVSHHLRLLNTKRSKLEKIAIPIFQSDLYIAASKDIPDAEIVRWQATLQTLKQNGRYQQILKKYLLTTPESNKRQREKSHP